MIEIEDEFEDLDLGDKRLNRRTPSLASTLARHPERSFPAAFGRGAELEACYRLLSNARVHADAILAPHRARTAARVRAQDVVLLVHDTTACTMPGEGIGLPQLQAGASARGFRCHLTLAVGADGR